MKTLKKILELKTSTIETPNDVIEFLYNHYAIISARYDYFEESMTFLFIVRLSFWAKLRYLFGRKYRAVVKTTLDESIKDIPSEFKVKIMLEL